LEDKTGSDCPGGLSDQRPIQLTEHNACEHLRLIIAYLEVHRRANSLLLHRQPNRTNQTATMQDLIDLSRLQTEAINPHTAQIDQVSTLHMCMIINDEDCKVASSVTPCLPTIAETIDALAPRVRGGGRVICIGAGTSGRFVPLFLLLNVSASIPSEGLTSSHSSMSRRTGSASWTHRRSHRPLPRRRPSSSD
jgi:hypothetical protein